MGVDYINTKNRYILIISLIVSLISFTSCFAKTDTGLNIASITSYHDIPHITVEEIAAIEAIKSEKPHLTFVSLPSIEAYVLPDGSHAGFQVMFSELLSGLFDIPFVHAIHDWPVMKSGIDEMIFDFTGDLTPNPERRLNYHMTEPIAYHTIGVFTYGDSLKILTEQDYNGLKLGFWEGTTTAQSIIDAYPEIHFEAVPLTGEIHEVEMVESGMVDAYVFEYVASSKYEDFDNIHIREAFPLVYSPVSLTTANDELKPFISVMDKYIAAGGIEILHALYHESQVGYKKYLLNKSFSKAEQDYIKLSEKVPIVMETDNYPISFYNANENEFQGIAMDILAEISKINGLTFEIINDKDSTWAELLEKLISGEAAMISELLVTQERQRDFLLTEVPYSSSYYALLSKTEFPYLEMYQVSQSLVGVIRGSSYENMYNKWFQNNGNLVLFDSADEAFDALERGNIDLYMTTEDRLLYQLNYREKPGYKANLVFTITTDSYFGFNKSEALLSQIINKSMSHIDTTKIQREWTSRVFDYSLAFARTQFTIVLLAAVSFLSILIFLAILLRQSIHKRKIAAQQNHLLKTANEKAEEAKNEANEANKRVNLMLDSTPLSCQIFDNNFNTIDCNDASFKMYGLQDKQEYINTFFNLMPEYQPDGRLSHDGALVMLKKVFEEGKCVFEWMHRLPDGELLPAEITLVRVSYSDTYVVAGYTRDLRDHKRIMANMTYRDELLNVVNQSAALLLNSDMESFQDAIIQSMRMIAETLTVDCVYLWKNQQVDEKLFCFQIFEWSLQETIFTDGELYSYSDVVPGWEETLSVGRIINSLVRNMSPKVQDHLVGIVSILVVPIFYEEKFWGFIGFDDCQKERIFTKEEETILHSGSLLVANAFIRNEQIKQMLEGMERERDLEIQKQSAQASNEAKTRFLANMSHEIRTPMNAIVGMSDLLLSEDLNIRQHRYAEDIKISSLSLLNIINDILDLSKIQATKLNLIPVHFDFISFIENVTSMIEFLIQDKMFAQTGKKLILVSDISDDIPECLYGDDVRLRQILLNLLSNAVKYTNEGTIAFKIRIDKTHLLITVADTGNGIPPEDLPTLFDAFAQADASMNRSRQGTGLGLSITKSLVDLMGGHISVESEYGKGSSFHLVLPFLPGDKNLLAVVHNEIKIVYAPDARVLAVDDRETNLSVICGLLHQCHIIADKASSGQQAIEMAVKKQYDLIFMDHMMPDMDGVETTQILRDRGVDIPIIALTANAVTGARELLLSSGMNDFLSKPIDKSMLYKILAMWIPSEKIVDKPEKTSFQTNSNNDTEIRNKNDNGFWNKIFTIQGLDHGYGLSLASGNYNRYKNTLETSMREIEGSVANLKTFLNHEDINKFRIEIHGIKGSLSLLGASELASKAQSIESASSNKNIGYCMAHTPAFLEELSYFYNELKEAFAIVWAHPSSILLPPELLPILTRISEAVENEDFMALFEESDVLEGMEFVSELYEEIDNLKGALMTINYKSCSAIIERLRGYV